MTEMMDEQTRASIKEIEEHSRFPTGIGRMERGECPRGFLSPMACMLCPNGHMLCCHFPLTCEEAQCSHYQQEMGAEDG